MRVVFDTNIYVSALAIAGGHAEDAYLEAVRGTFELFTRPYALPLSPLLEPPPRLNLFF